MEGSPGRFYRRLGKTSINKKLNLLQISRMRVGCIQTANRNIKISRGDSRCLKYTEHSDFTLLFCRERLRNIQSFIMHVHKPFVLPRSRCRCRRGLLKVPYAPEDAYENVD